MSIINIEFENIEQFTGHFIGTIEKLEPRDEQTSTIFADEIADAVAKYLGAEVKEKIE